jgi:hypothetical protein
LRYQMMVQDHPMASRVAQLHTACEDQWTVSINAWAFQLRFFLEQGLPYNKYRFEAFRRGREKVYHADWTPASLSSPVNWTAFQHVLAEDPQDAAFAPKRMALNQWADQEEEFSYGAYYVEGGGAGSFGEFCMILKPEAVRSMQEISFLQFDSAQHYVQHDSHTGQWCVAEDLVHTDVASVHSVTHLMCIKLNQELAVSEIGACKELICNDSSYLESQIAEKFDKDVVAYIRAVPLSLGRHQLLTDLIARDQLGLPDDQLELHEIRVRDYHKAMAILAQEKVKIEYL